MIIRREYRGCIKSGIDEGIFNYVVAKASAAVSKEIKKGKLVELCLYRYKSMCFLYFEAEEERTCEEEGMRNKPDFELRPENLLESLTPFLEEWPDEEGKTPWVFMYPVFYQQKDIRDISEWTKERNPSKTRVGRIAFLFPDKLSSYVRWHKALVDEGLLKGDKYQYISLHENILFSYYEEPRTNVSITGGDEESEVIDKWLSIDPGSHFDQSRTEGRHFLPITPLIMQYGI